MCHRFAAFRDDNSFWIEVFEQGKALFSEFRSSNRLHDPILRRTKMDEILAIQLAEKILFALVIDLQRLKPD